MKKTTILGMLFSTSFLLISQPNWSNSANYWQCTTADAENKTWTIQGDYQLTATNESFASCKKESALPKTCKTSRNDCDHFVNGRTTRPMWRCVALDRAAGIWPSNTYPVRDDAALAAQAYCKSKSDIPGTCYTNMITCRNINAQHAMSE